MPFCNGIAKVQSFLDSANGFATFFEKETRIGDWGRTMCPAERRKEIMP